LSSIAQRFNVSLEALLAANRLTASATLRIGQELVIPGGPPTATPKPQPTPMPTPTPAPDLPAAVLVGPNDQAAYGENEQIKLAWQPVLGLVAGDKYRVDILYDDEGGVPVNYYWYTPSTEQSVPTWLWRQAKQPFRKYQWFIRAVRLTTDGQGGELVIPLNPASEIRTFYWK